MRKAVRYMDGTGERLPDMVAGFQAWHWVKLFRQCFEWHWDGGSWTKKGKKGATRTGYFSQVCFPEDGGLGDQPNIVIEIFQIIKDEESRMQADRF